MIQIFLVFFTLISQSGFSMPAQVLLIRHGEKPEQGGDLSEQGYARARALPEFFKTNPTINRYGSIAAIYAMKQAKPGSSNRAVETVAPTAQALNLEIHQNFTREEIQSLVDEIEGNSSFDGRSVLICWEHAMIPLIAQAFGLQSGPKAWSGSVYDQVWILRFNANGRIDFSELGEGVLPLDKTPSS